MIFTKTLNRVHRTRALGFLVLAAIILGFIFTEPIAQEIHYHGFTQDIKLFGVSNFWNVISNLPFVVIGALGLLWWGKLLRFFNKNNLLFPKNWLRLEPLLFVGLIFIGFGSAYYHFDPNTTTLFWDRLPMALVFSTLFVLVVRDFVSFDLSKKIQFPIIITSLLSVAYWLVSEHFGRGDLRPYVLVQFLPMILIPYFLCINNYHKNTNYLWGALAFYVFAKLAEHFDVQVFELTHLVAGHPIKHLLAAIAMIFVIKHIQKQVQ